MAYGYDHGTALCCSHARALCIKSNRRRRPEDGAVRDLARLPSGIRAGGASARSSSAWLAGSLRPIDRFLADQFNMVRQWSVKPLPDHPV